MTASSSAGARLAVDIGGTFTDVALEVGGRLVTTKVLTTPAAPEEGVLTGIAKVIGQAGIAPVDVSIIIHGTTLATNALIERKGAKTTLLTTEGFRDSVEMAYENRFEQYDINIDRPKPLVPRHLRLPVRERLNVKGEALIALDEQSVHDLIPVLKQYGVESVAIGFIHAYANPAHEQRTAEILREALPDLSYSLSSEVCPEVREYERQSTTCANAYVQPLMASYLARLKAQLHELGYGCPFFMITSGGGLTALDTAMKFPIRLVESGPAGGAILASRIAAECGLNEVVSYDMGGTTAKLCLIDKAQPLASRTFEVDRVYRFMKGSGLPIRIPVIEMVEIGAGGGSIAHVDTMKRITVGPESAGSVPGPACYDQGGTRPTVTDADVVMGRIDPSVFAGGTVHLAPEKSKAAMQAEIGSKLNLSDALAAFGIAEVVDENMANAARVHAIEWGKDIARRAMIAFGGAAPLHAARLAEKLEIDTIIIPTGAGVGSALGFLKAPVAYEVVRSRHMKLSQFDSSVANATLKEMQEEALSIVREGAPTADLVEIRQAYMRYVGQGHEIAVDVPVRDLTQADAQHMASVFAEAYSALYGRTIPNLDIEILSWTLTTSTKVEKPAPVPMPKATLPAPEPKSRKQIFDPVKTDHVEAGIYWRPDLKPGMKIPGPALIAEEQTTTVVSSSFDALINELDYIVLVRKPAA
ncbi:MAG: hydantoinase/oxoprolinase family protein [Oceanibaculum nanhaiense]|uniref:hydantoinase/oxoprolinase family protein n=1 Tax=Oceanibaculum nanhaiense TaxID=1909734 RepID=UPI0025A33BF9|nr:hydantoinase/oxoprolinase family protein [Oceanibaculum nanhaiense]MDM7946989.1 hydantoinase/oxoprolinase family protein [Oceanibaculum nanhaiense]